MLFVPYLVINFYSHDIIAIWYLVIGTYVLSAVGAKSLKKVGATEIEVEDFGDSEGLKILVDVYIYYSYVYQ